MNKCEICNKEILNDSQFIDGKWYHNKCIKNCKIVLDKIKEYTNGNIQALENRLNTPFCNFDKATKELSIYQNYLELLEEIE